MERAQAAELKTVLSGAPLPARKAELLEYAVRQHAEPQLLSGLRSLSEAKEYESLDAVVEDLLHAQPDRSGPQPHEPREAGGQPPGGDAYTEQDPETGTIRE